MVRSYSTDLKLISRRHAIASIDSPSNSPSSPDPTLLRAVRSPRAISAVVTASDSSGPTRTRICRIATITLLRSVSANAARGLPYACCPGSRSRRGDAVIAGVILIGGHSSNLARHRQYGAGGDDACPAHGESRRLALNNELRERGLSQIRFLNRANEFGDLFGIRLKRVITDHPNVEQVTEANI